jgi:hypothetical protein
MKAELYGPVEFRVECTLADANLRLQKAGHSNSGKWCIDAQDGRFQLTPTNWEFSGKQRVFWPEVFGFLASHGSGTSVRLAFRPTAEGWVSWAFFALCVLISLIVSAVTGDLVPVLIFAAWDILLFLFCALLVRCGKKHAEETVRQILERE